MKTRDQLREERTVETHAQVEETLDQMEEAIRANREYLLRSRALVKRINDALGITTRGG
jgi:hypothetical protein